MSQPHASIVSPRPARKRERADPGLDSPSHKRTKEHADFSSSSEDNGEHLVAEETEAGTEESKSCHNRCWKCRLLDLECNGDVDTICDHCSPLISPDDKRRFKCRRDNLADSLKGKIPNTPGIGSDEWLLPVTGGVTLKIRLTYSNPDVKVQDLKHFDSWWEDVSCKSTEAIVEFLEQFHDINTRWAGNFEPVTEDIITVCAETQADILTTTRPGRKPLSKAQLLICSALRVLALAYHISDLDGNLIPSHPDTFRFQFLKPTALHGTHNPSINVSRAKGKAAIIPSADGELSLMIQDIIQTTQRLIFLRRPHDWPIIFCTLCLLKLISSALTPLTPWIDTFDGGVRALEDAWDTLCRLFAYYTEPHHPLDPNFNLNTYTRIVGRSHLLAAEVFENLHGIWTDGNFEGGSTGDNFQERLSNFAMGFIL